MTQRILQGDVFDILPTIAAGSVDCVCTSPPYWMLRSYLPKGHALKPLELGSEPTPAAYVENMVRVFRLVREAMADHGTVWLNIGDSYSSGSRTGVQPVQTKRNGELPHESMMRPAVCDIVGGNLCLIPWRLAIALQDDGWLVRSVVVWHKPAPMPASLSGWQWRRCRVKVKAGTMRSACSSAHRPRLPVDGHGGVSQAVAHGTTADWQDCPGCAKCEPAGGYVLRRGSWRPTSSWEPILMLAKSARYFADGEPVKTSAAAATVSRDQYTRILDDPDEQFAVAHDHETTCDSGANLRDVWTIAAEPLREKHYAAYPSKLVENCLRAGTSAKGYCPACGAPWVRVVDLKARPHPGQARPGYRGEVDCNGGNQANGTAALAPETTTLGWRPSCICNAGEPRPGLVLDPFAGSGRTLTTAAMLGLDAVGCELNEAYVEMATRRLKETLGMFS